MILGTYECKIDAKGRFLIPSDLKKQLVEVSENQKFVIKRSVFESCLEIYPEFVWEELMKKVSQLNPFVKKNNIFIRKFTSGLRVMELDASGRILLPKELIDYAGLNKNIVLSSAVNLIEVWDKEKYETAVSDNDDFSNLAEEVMGDKNFDND